MTHILVKQPNEMLAIWCTDVDNFIVADATAAEVLEYELTREESKIIEWIDSSLKHPQTTYAELKQIHSRLGQDWAGV